MPSIAADFNIRMIIVKVRQYRQGCPLTKINALAYKKMGPGYFVPLFFFFLLSIEAVAHSNILYGISLDFDPELKMGVIQAAQKFLKVKEMPITFDYDFELIAAKFDRKLELSVLVNPSDNSIFGFRDDSLVSSGKEVFSSEKMGKIAEKAFEKYVPEPYKKELLFAGEKKLYQGVYEFIWFRYVDGVAVMNEHFTVEVDPVDGDVVSFRLSLFSSPQEGIRTRPGITAEVAQKISELSLNGQPLPADPLLLINKDRPVWLVKVKKIYPIFAGIDALDGRVVFSGNARTELPPGYSVGRDIPVVETELLRSILNR